MRWYRQLLLHHNLRQGQDAHAALRLHQLLEAIASQIGLMQSTSYSNKLNLGDICWNGQKGNYL